ncbi:amine oxidase [Ascoidea rubescens DSM 1968]|uniref:Amine oxidase n=1 Tax=Ascoidea rubescens DSM 1968 TaxID=1344418 RepID=A0A1D2VI33_9ASCO|nr:amine oxidase [Ascoidea rubescens DSM 1968]ODV61269.1 amine oxidase [Ascoidea rubescens DSM 1968]
MERLQQIAAQATASVAPPPTPAHPLDPLSIAELKAVVSVVKNEYSTKDISFNTVTLREPTKDAYLNWKERNGPLPPRLAYFVILEKNVAGVQEGVVDLGSLIVITLKTTEGVQPILTVEDLQTTESIIRKDPRVIEQCVISGVPADKMHEVYCDPWTIGYDERWGSAKRLQQAFMYWRSNEDDSQYSHPLDFCPIVDTEAHEVVFIDIPQRRRKVSKHPHANFNPPDVKKKTGYRTDAKPINVTQPEGVSFKMENNIMEWSNFKFHVGFNYREGIVLSDITFNDHGKIRPLFHRISLVEQIVPYGNPYFPHQRKHALDIGEYGAGLMTNPLSLGCDCKGVIHYLDAHFVDRAGDPITVKHAVCIHEEDNGLLFKHSDFRDNFATSIVTRATKLVISQIYTAANYEYCLYWNFMQDGTIQLEVKLTGILNTYVCDENEVTDPFGTKVYPMVNAHNHQHLFSLRVHPRIDGDGNSAATVDAASYEPPLGSPENMYGNGFYAKKTVFKTVKDSLTNYESSTGRSWDIFNPKSIHPYSGKPATYKLVSTHCPPLLCKPGSLVSKRAPWADKSVQVVPFKEDPNNYYPEASMLYPSGEHVPQWSGEGVRGMRKWIGNGDAPIENTDILFFHTFGITHFPAPEDFPLMPVEPFSLLLRPRNLFLENPTLDVVPSHAMTTSEARAATNQEVVSKTDTTSRLAFQNTSGQISCCRFQKE